MSVRRIFWLGADKVFHRTELCQLREMAFEVFSPPYISSVHDYSADRMVDREQQTTLPLNIFLKLMATDFSGMNLTPEITDILESYFDAVIIAGNPACLRSFAGIYRRPIILRTYGRDQNLSEYFINAGLWERLVGRDNFTVVPFCPEAVEGENRWFRDLCHEYVPYQLADDVYAHSGLWNRVERDPIIATSMPYLEDPAHRAAYEAFNTTYPHKVFRIYGSQRSRHPDTRVVGEIERQAFLRSLAGSSGFFHPHEEWACDLSPIEMMELGGPVLYAPGSLLTHLYGEQTPGLIDNKVSGERKLRYLLNDDAHFISEVIASQEPVRQRFERTCVRPAFKEVFSRLLGNLPQREPLTERDRSDSAGHSPGRIEIRGRSKPQGTKTIALLLHADGLNSLFSGGAYPCEGIQQMSEALLRTIIRTTDFRLLVSCLSSHKSDFYDLFAREIHSGRMELHVVEYHDGAGGEIVEELARLNFVERLNGREDICLVIVPHPSLFPESLLLEHRVSLYLPDYFSLLLGDVASRNSGEETVDTANVGMALIRKASAVFTTRESGAQQLIAAGAIDANVADKLIVVPTQPVSREQTGFRHSNRETQLESRIAGRRFLFYPAANRPGRNIAFFLKLFASLRQAHPDLLAVLTEPADAISAAKTIVDTFNLHPHLEIVQRASDAEIAWLYRNSHAVCVTSTREGGFPVPVRYALSYCTPVVVTRLPEIAEILGDEAEQLLLCNPLDMADFSDKVILALEQRDRVLQGQSRILALLTEKSATGIFDERLNVMLGVALGNPVDGDKACA